MLDKFGIDTSSKIAAMKSILSPLSEEQYVDRYYQIEKELDVDGTMESYDPKSCELAYKYFLEGSYVDPECDPLIVLKGAIEKANVLMDANPYLKPKDDVVERVRSPETKIARGIAIYKELFDASTVKGSKERKANSSIIINKLMDELDISKVTARSYMHTIRKELEK